MSIADWATSNVMPSADILETLAGSISSSALLYFFEPGCAFTGPMPSAKWSPAVIAERRVTTRE